MTTNILLKTLFLSKPAKSSIRFIFLCLTYCWFIFARAITRLILKLKRSLANKLKHSILNNYNHEQNMYSIYFGNIMYAICVL